MTTITKDSYSSGVLDEAVHHRLLDNLPKVLGRAGIAGHQDAVWTPLSEVCGEMEVAWATELWKHVPAGSFGLVYDLDRVPDAHARMVALTGCLVRNFVSVRLTTLSQVVQEQREGDNPDEDVLVIPNFFVLTDARDMPPWRRGLIHELVSTRVMAGRD